jgi:hypothetical protein
MQTIAVAFLKAATPKKFAMYVALSGLGNKKRLASGGLRTPATRCRPIGAQAFGFDPARSGTMLPGARCRLPMHAHLATASSEHTGPLTQNEGALTSALSRGSKARRRERESLMQLLSGLCGVVYVALTVVAMGGTKDRSEITRLRDACSRRPHPVPLPEGEGVKVKTDP